MIEDIKTALAEYKDSIDIYQKNDKTIVEITEYTHKFNNIATILKTNYNAEYVPYDKTKKLNACFIITNQKTELPKQSPAEALRYHLKQALKCLDDLEKVQS